MKRVTITLLICLVISASAAAFDWGGQLTNTSGISAGSYLQRNSLTLDFGTLFADTFASEAGARRSSQLGFDGQIAYRFSLDTPVAIDISQLRLRWSRGDSSLALRRQEVELGRLTLSDPTQLVVVHPIDGARFTFGYGIGTGAFQRTITSRTTIGYSGFVFEPSSAINLTRSDQADYASLTNLGPFEPGIPRILGMSTLQIAPLFGLQRLTSFWVFQEDLRPEAQRVQPGTTTENPGRGGQLDSQYLGVQLDGPIGPFSYRSYYVLNTGRMLSYVVDPESPTGRVYQYAPISGHLAGAQVAYTNRELLLLRVVLSGFFSSGDADFSGLREGNTEGDATAFVPIAASPAGTIAPAIPGNLSAVRLGASVRPLPLLRVEAAGQMLFRMQQAPVAISGVDPGTPGNYLGTELSLRAEAEVFSDLNVNLRGAYLIVSDPFAVSESILELALGITLLF